MLALLQTPVVMQQRVALNQPAQFVVLLHQTAILRKFVVDPMRFVHQMWGKAGEQAARPVMAHLPLAMGKFACRV